MALLYIIYIYGGIYLDIKFESINNFKFINLIKNNNYIFVKDRIEYFKKGDEGIYNALIATYPKNPLFLDCINTIIDNINNNYYGYTSLYPTGPGLLGIICKKYNIKQPKLKFDGKNILNNNIILKEYENYREDQKQNNIKPYYILWNNQNIYKFKYSAIIIEPRINDILFELVLSNFFKNLDNRWCFIIFHGNLNKNNLLNLINQKFENEKHRIILYNMNIDNLTINQYSLILLSKDIYNYIPTEMFLIFKLDTLISDIYNYKIYDFMKYDYVGAPWSDGGVGNGGLSLRRKSKMLKLINNTIFNKDNLPAEDGFFSDNLHNLYKPNFEKAKEFSIESIYYPFSFGMHDYIKHFDINNNYIKDNIRNISKHIPDIIKSHEYNIIMKKKINNIIINDISIFDMFNNMKMITF